MNTNTLIDAVGMIDDTLLEKALSPQKAKRYFIKPLISIAAALAIMIGALPTATALGSDNSYNLLYTLFPSAAQSFKPVRKSCTDNGIELSVISADITGSEARVFFSVRDIEGSRLDETIDLFDSYYLNTPFGTANTCRLVSFDKESSTAYFVSDTSTMKGESLNDKKLTFGFSTLLLGKKSFLGELPVTLSDVDTAPDTQKGLPHYSGGSYMGEDISDMIFLKTSDKIICEPIEGAAVTAVGYTDGALHIQIRLSDSHTLDTHGFVSIKDKNGREFESPDIYDFHFMENGFSYQETVIPIDHSALSQYSLYGDFTKASHRINGSWQVTARLG